MTQVKIIVLICLVMGFTGSFAQKIEKELDEEEVQLLNQIRVINPEPSNRNQISVFQQGGSNEAYIQQVNSTSNFVESYQFGYGNQIQMNQEGSSFSAFVIQTGDSNNYGADIEGYDANLNVFQVGRYNTINQHSELNNANLTIIQIGDGHELTQERDISHSQGMRIIQRGNGAKAFIR